MPSHLALAAKAQLDNEAFEAAIKRMEDHWLDAIRNSEPGDQVEREIAYRMLRTLADFIDELHGFLSDDAHERGRAVARQMMGQ